MLGTKCIEGANREVLSAGHVLVQGAPVYMKSWRLAIPQITKLFQRKEFHLVTAKFSPLKVLPYTVHGRLL